MTPEEKAAAAARREENRAAHWLARGALMAQREAEKRAKGAGDASTRPPAYPASVGTHPPRESAPTGPLTLAEVREAQGAAVADLRERIRSGTLKPRDLGDCVRQLRLIESDMSAAAEAAKPTGPPAIVPSRRDLGVIIRLARGEAWSTVVGGDLPADLLRLLREGRGTATK